MSAYYADGTDNDLAPWNDPLDEFEPDPDAEFERIRDERLFDE